eukprot:TRINITY_DN1290_c2_g2_i5.p2 TRINITY_DN1290_c2_g2~~TRINITY_DN1290_c2_g2_i5.p2  ORF type:complete len:109 (-),score=12.05 TRINITY_DN1290_c2_g2_i5:232-558(-)
MIILFFLKSSLLSTPTPPPGSAMKKGKYELKKMNKSNRQAKRNHRQLAKGFKIRGKGGGGVKIVGSRRKMEKKSGSCFIHWKSSPRNGDSKVWGGFVKRVLLSSFFYF